MGIVAIGASEGGPAAMAAYEPPNPIYAAPGTYYNAATGTGPTLKANLKTIISTGFIARTYEDSKYADSLLDQDPANPSNILTVYSRTSVSGLWDAGSTWDREHLWPKSRLPAGDPNSGTKSQATDLFELRPCVPMINSTRSNSNYGTPASSGSYGYDGTNTYWYPSDADAGDAARSMFYMATRYGDGASPNNLVLVNGDTAIDGQMGDKAALLKFHYTDGVDNFERRRNHLIYTADNGVNGWNTSGRAAPFNAAPYNSNYHQGNRNPYIDHPEYVWAIFGTHIVSGNIVNDSQLSVATPGSNGASSTTVTMKVIRNATMPTGNVTLTNGGTDPTTYDVTTTGLADATYAGAGQGIWGTASGSITKSLTLNLTGGTATTGLKTGTYTIHNTDLTTSGTGRGSADADDVITVNTTVVDHANGSFDSPADTNAQTFDYGYVPVGFAARTNGYNIFNLQAASGFTANLRCTALVNANGGAVMSGGGSTFTALAGGASNSYTASMNPVSVGTISNATSTFTMADEIINGATSNTSLVLTQKVVVLPLSNPTIASTNYMDLRTGETYSPSGTWTVNSGVTLTRMGPGTLNIGTQSNQANTTLALTGGATTFNADAGSAGAFPLTVTAANSGTALHLNSTQHLAALTLGTGTSADLTAGNDKTLVTKSLSLTGSGTLDLNDNKLVVMYGTTPTPINAIKTAVQAGRGGTDFANAPWNGAGINSTSASAAGGGDGISFAIGYVDNSFLPNVGLASFTSFGGQTVDSASVLVRYTRGADANLDGLVNGDDVTIVGTDFNAGGTGEWFLGDFDYDGICDGDDVTVLGALYDPTAPPLSGAELTAQYGSGFATAFERGRQLGPANVPEPSSLMVLGIGAAALLKRSRRGRS